jgi:DNA phosphorothioation-dependent restriction protein DptG
MAVSVMAFAQDAPKPDTKGVHLIKPFSELKDLTPDQVTKLKEIHKKYLEEWHALEAKAKEDSMAILTDDQKKEVAEIEAKKGTKATTKPATK